MTQPNPANWDVINPTAAPPAGALPNATQALAQYDQAYTQAHTARLAIAQQLADAQKRLIDLPIGPAESLYPSPQRRDLETQVASLQRSYDTLLQQELKAANDRNDAYTQAAQRADPANRQVLDQTAAKAKTDAERAQSEYDEWTKTAPERRAAVAANQRLANLQGDQADLNNQYQKETDPLKKKQLEQQLVAGEAAVKQAQAQAEVAQRTIGSQVTTAAATATTAQAGADVAAGTVTPTITTAQETANQAGIATQTQQAQLDDLLRRVRQAPTDEQARAALQQALDAGAAGIAATRASTAGTEASTEGTRASTEATRANTAVTQLGTLAGLDQYLAAQHDALAKGLMTPDQATQALNARLAGTDVYSATTAAEKAQMDRLNQMVTQRGQDTGLVSGARSNLSSFGSNAFSTISGAASKAHHGSGDALAGGYEAMMSDLTNRYGGPSAFQTPADVVSPGMPALLQQYAAPPPQQPAAPAPPPAPAPGPDPATVAAAVHAAVSAASSPSAPAAASPEPAAPDTGFLFNNPSSPIANPANTPDVPQYANGTMSAQGGPALVGERGPEIVNLPQGAQVMPTFLQRKMPVHPRDVIAMYPGAARRAGML